MHTLILAAILALLAATQATQPDPTTIGSTRNAAVAYRISDPSNSPTLTYIAPDLSEEQLAELKEVAPNVNVVTVSSRGEALEHAAEAHAVDGRFYSPEFHAAATNLVWVESPSAGVNWILDDTLRNDGGVVLTNMRAVHGPAIADHAFAMLLTLTRSLRHHEEHQRQGRWVRGDITPEPIALRGRTMFVVGLGGIGSEIAKRAKGFDMRVIASRRSLALKPDYVDVQGTPEQLHEMLGQADVVAICLPLTEETRGLFDEEAFAAMKTGAYVINIARGAIMDQEALLGALRSGHVGGACLDVTDPEPLPGDHPLWSEPNVVITPHVASIASLTTARRWALTKENVRRFGAGEPLLNTVDKEAGY